MFRSTSKGREGLCRNYVSVVHLIFILADEKLNTLVLNSVLAGKNKSQELFSVCPSKSLNQFQKKQDKTVKEFYEECDVRIPEVKNKK